MDRDSAQSAWWGEYRFAEDQTTRWEIGPLTLALRRTAHEWQLAHHSAEGADEAAAHWSVTEHAPAPRDDELLQRYVFAHTAGSARIMPALADRPVVTRPVTPFFIPSGVSVTIYVSSPLWVCIAFGATGGPLAEIPIQRPSDTWFGPSTRSGELCYASRTSCRLSLAEVPIRPHRAVTPVTIDNRADDALLLERLNLPVPYLSLFSDAYGALWTEAVSLLREQDAELATLNIGSGAAPDARPAQRIGGPRHKPEQNVLVRAFGALFG